MKRTNFTSKLLVMIMTTAMTLSYAAIQEYGNLLLFMRKDFMQQFTTLILQLNTSDFY